MWNFFEILFKKYFKYLKNFDRQNAINKIKCAIYCKIIKVKGLNLFIWRVSRDLISKQSLFN